MSPGKHEEPEPVGQPEEVQEPEDQGTEPGGEVVEVSMDQLLQTFRELGPKLKRAEEALKRERADFVNYRRRIEQRTEELAYESRRGLLKELFPLFDIFFSTEQGLKKHEDFESLQDAFEVLGKELHRVLEHWGVEVIADTDVQFSPDRHEVAYTRPAEEAGEPMVDEVIRPGYVQGDRVLRTAQVVVRQPASE